MNVRGINSRDRDQLVYRQIQAVPRSWNEKEQSVRFVLATENPVRVWDWERYEMVDEVLLMDGLQLPANRQVPLLDSHNSSTVQAILGSVRNFDTPDRALEGDLFFSSVPEGQSAAIKAREGHLTDGSVGYWVTDALWIPEGERASFNGREFAGPLKVARQWALGEFSLTPIGADAQAKARGAMGVTNRNEREVRTMNKKLIQALINRGLKADATDQEAREFMLAMPADELQAARTEAGLVEPPAAPAPAPAAVPPAAPAPVVDINEVRRQVYADMTEIRGLCAIAQMPEHFDVIVQANPNLTVEQARAEIFKELHTRQAANSVATRIEAGTDSRDKYRAAATDAILIRAGFSIPTPALGATDLAGYSLRELARESLRMAGRPIGGNVMEMIGRAFMTSDFPIILSAGANKALLEGWNAADQQEWREWCAIGSLPDFKGMNLISPSEFSDLQKVKEHGEYKYGKRAEYKEMAFVEKYGALFSITREAIINDDMGAFTDTPRNMGDAAIRLVNSLPHAVLTVNAKMGDGVDLFHATHKNLGTAAAFTIQNALAAIQEAEKLMRLQTNLLGKQALNIPVRFFIAPVALKGAADQYFNTQHIGSTDAGRSNMNNPFFGDVIRRFHSPNLDAASATAYYFLGPKGRTVTVYFLNGQQTPYLEEKAGWSVDGVEYKVRIEAGAKAIDWRGMVKNAGQ